MKSSKSILHRLLSLWFFFLDVKTNWRRISNLVWISQFIGRAKMKLMFFPVTMIEEFPHALLYFNFTRKKDRYFLSPYDVEVSAHGSQRTVCDIIRSSDFLCGLLDIDRPSVLKEISSIPSTGSVAECSPAPSTTNETSGRRALSSSSPSPSIHPSDPLLAMIEQRLDFKHRCMFYSTGPTSDLCGMCKKHSSESNEERSQISIDCQGILILSRIFNELKRIIDGLFFSLCSRCRLQLLSSVQCHRLFQFTCLR